MRSTIGVITNIRPDHLDVMGPTVDDVAVALSSTVPRRRDDGDPGDARYADSRCGGWPTSGARSSSSRKPEDVPAGAMDGLRLPRARGERRHRPRGDPLARRSPTRWPSAGCTRRSRTSGACTCWELPHKGRRDRVHNIFAANDLESTITVWQQARPRRSAATCRPSRCSICAADRIDRSLQYAEAVENDLRADHYVLVGGRTRRACCGGSRGTFRRGACSPSAQATPEDVFDRIAETGPASRARVGGDRQHRRNRPRDHCASSTSAWEARRC